MDTMKILDELYNTFFAAHRWLAEVLFVGLFAIALHLAVSFLKTRSLDSNTLGSPSPSIVTNGPQSPIVTNPQGPVSINPEKNK